MITFKTQFPINTKSDINDLLEVGRVWLAGSPYSKLAHTMSVMTKIEDEWKKEIDNESIIFTSYKDDTNLLCGIRHENIDDNSVRWLTEVVGSKQNDNFLVSIQLSVDSELPVEKLDIGKRPHIIKNIMQQIKGGMDGQLPVCDCPIYL